MNWAVIGPIIASIITGGLTLAGVIINNRSSQKVAEAKQDARMDALETQLKTNHAETSAAIADLKAENNKRIEELKKEQQKHNDLMDRTYKVEGRVAVLESHK